MQAGVKQGEIISSVLFSLYVKDLRMPSQQTELGQMPDDPG
jgi:hypothetical protein